MGCPSKEQHTHYTFIELEYYQYWLLREFTVYEVFSVLKALFCVPHFCRNSGFVLRHNAANYWTFSFQPALNFMFYSVITDEPYNSAIEA